MAAKDGSLTAMLQGDDLKHWFTGFTQFDEAKVRKLAERKDWMAAHRVIQKQPLQLGWLEGHVAHLAELQPELKKIAGRQPSQLRLRGFGWQLLSSKPVHLGVVCAAAFRHQVADHNQTAISVFEKVEVRKRKRSIQQQLMLFQSINVEKLLAPQYYGKVKHGSFISLFYQCIDGEHPAEAEMAGYRVELLQHFWSLKVPRALRDAGKKQAFLPQAFSAKRLQSHINKATSPAQSDALHWLLAQRKKLIACYRRLPAVVMHEDISSSNVLIDKDKRLWLLDWDKWSLNRVGAGLKLQPSQLFEPEVLALIDWYCGYNPKVNKDMLRFNICLYNLVVAMKQRKLSTWLTWYDLCRQYYSKMPSGR